ncbi:MAG: hypothetical protein CL931_12440 [Deltaproteobacteria bacterium]|nr:hypothetical protein [Deltaproteobacteria bacterium]
MRVGSLSLVHLAASLAAIAGLVGCAEEGPYTADLAAEMMSPYCPGRTIASCPSPQAGELIQWIQVQEAAGASKEEVVEMLVERFGEDIYGAPPAEGATLFAYVLPVAGFLGGGGVVVVALRRLVGARGREDDLEDEDLAPSRPAAAPAAPQADEDELARLVDEELANRR